MFAQKRNVHAHSSLALLPAVKENNEKRIGRQQKIFFSCRGGKKDLLKYTRDLNLTVLLPRKK